MCRNFVWAIVIALVMVTGCGERGGSIFPIPHLPADEHIENPTKADVISDIKELISEIGTAEVISEMHSVKSHIFLVKILRDGEPHWYKVTYLYLESKWVAITDYVEM